MTADSSMRAVVIDRFGGPEVLRVADLPVPRPRPGEVLIRVGAAGINAIDWKTRAGRGVSIQRFPAVLGWDVSGTVVATGPGTSRVRPGDEVFGMVRFPSLASAYAEFVTAPEGELAVKPSGVEHRGAAGAMVALTAWQTLFDRGGLAQGQRVLVHGAAGGVGHVAVQLARSVGAAVICTASENNREFLLDLGARTIVDYRTTGWEDSVRDCDIVVDTRGGADFYRLVRTLRPGGIIVTIVGPQPGHEAAVNQRGVRAGYSYVTPNGPLLARIAELMANGSLRIHVERAFALDEVAEAHAVGDAGHVRGLLVLEISAA